MSGLADLFHRDFSIVEGQLRRGTGTFNLFFCFVLPPEFFFEVEGAQVDRFSWMFQVGRSL